MNRRMAGSSRQNDRTSVFLEHEQLSSRPDQMCMHALAAASVFLPQSGTPGWRAQFRAAWSCELT